jgi:hypothetical protein
MTLLDQGRGDRNAILEMEVFLFKRMKMISAMCLTGSVLLLTQPAMALSFSGAETTNGEGRPLNATADFNFDGSDTFQLVLTNTLDTPDFYKSQQMITGITFSLLVIDESEYVSDTSEGGLTLTSATGELITIDQDGNAIAGPIDTALSWSFHTGTGDSEHPAAPGDAPYEFSLLDFHPNAENGIVPEASDEGSGLFYDNFRGGIAGHDPYAHHQGVFEIYSSKWTFSESNVDITDVTIYFGTDLSGSQTFPPDDEIPPPSIPPVPVPAAGWVGVLGFGALAAMRRRRH